MKHLLSFITLLAVLGSSVSARNSDRFSSYDDETIVIELEKTEKGDRGHEERGLYYISATYDPIHSSVIVAAFGIGQCEVYLYSSLSSELVSQVEILPEVGIGVLPVPSESGQYCLMIDSSRFFALGYFSK